MISEFFFQIAELKKLEKFIESNSICMKLLNIYPENADVLYDIASNFLKLNDIEQFLKFLQKAVNVMPTLKNKSKNNKEFEKFFTNEIFVDITS